MVFLIAHIAKNFLRSGLSQFVQIVYALFMIVIVHVLSVDIQIGTEILVCANLVHLISVVQFVDYMVATDSMVAVLTAQIITILILILSLFTQI